MILKIALAGLSVLVLALAGCRDAGPSDSAVVVTASTTQLADIARNVAGDRAEVTGILSPNSDPHDYEPRPSDAEALAESDLILRSGGDLDSWLDQLVDSSGSDAPVLTALDAAGAEGDDPHWWQDPRAGIAVTEAIRDELSDVDPEGAMAYARNAAAYVARLRELDAEIQACMDRVPAGERLLVTSHDALGRYAERYGIEVVGAAIPALSTQAQASAGETADLVDTIRETGVKTIFPEAGVSAELEKVIADEAGAQIGGELWADALGPEGSAGATYVGSLAANTETLVEGFTGGERACRIAVPGS
jgi:ABC-type Zn uptake system ZnuABC Zn-binding protein ZnuA